MCCRGWAILLLALIIALCTGILDHTGGLPPSAMQPWDGKAFATQPSSRGWADVFYGRGDSLAGLTASDLQLFEDGRQLGPPHSVHTEIAAKGGGRYSHWIDYLVFSTSDGTDPRINGRRYTFVVPPVPWRLLLPPGLLLAGLLHWRQRRGLVDGLPEIRWAAPFVAPGMQLVTRSRRAICYVASLGVAAYVVATYAYGAPPIPLITPDSGAYWAGYSVRTIGYPAFLWAVVGAFGSLRAVVLAQLVLFIISVFAVQTAIERVTRSSVLALATAIALLVLGEARTYAIALMADSTFTSLLLLHAAAAGHAFARPSRLAFLGMAATAVLATAIRPVGYVLFGGILFLLLFWSRGRRPVFLWVLCPAVVLFAAYFVSDRAFRTGDSGGVGEYDLFIHVSAIYQPPPNLSPALIAATQGPVLKSYQDARRDAASWTDRQMLEQNSTQTITDEVCGRIGDCVAADAAAALVHLSFYTIMHHPVGYLKIILENLFVWYKNMILASQPDVGPNLVSDYKSQWPAIEYFFTLYYDRPAELSLGSIEKDWLLTQPSATLLAFAVSSDWQSVIKIVFIAVGILAVIFFVIGDASPSEILVAYVAALTAGGALLVSLTSVFLLRYAIPLDPLVLITVIVGTWAALVRWAAAMRRIGPFARSTAV
jgi:hypothetical protein